MSREAKTSRAEARLICLMTKRGGKAFRILRSAEVAPKRYKRRPPSGAYVQARQAIKEGL